MTQLVTSVSSLRRHNDDVGIVLFAYGALPPGLDTTLRSWGVDVWPLEPYEARLAALAPQAWPVLARYPLLHKCLNFAEIGALGADQVLMLDCDTLFTGDVATLFDRYDEPDLVAREEVGSRRNHHGYDPSMIDEDALAALGTRLGVEPARPFNMGVVLLNNGLWDRLAGLAALYVGYTWRFQVWMAANPPQPGNPYGEGLGIDELRQHLATLPPREHHLALPYPSANRWILDEVALWVTLGHLPATTQCDFARTDAIQNGEFGAPDQPPGWTVCHYFSQNTDRIAGWAREHAVA